MTPLPFQVTPAAVRGVKNPLPAPTECRYCGADVKLVCNRRIYGKPFGKWPWVYSCTECDAYVGLHPNTHIPLGTLANSSLRAHRSAFKDVFNRLWVPALDGRWSRTKAYTWLAGVMKIPVKECHGGWFDEAQCISATQYCRVQLSRWNSPTTRSPDDQAAKQHHVLEERSERIPDWYDERNQYLAPDDGKRTQAVTGSKNQSPPWK